MRGTITRRGVTATAAQSRTLAAYHGNVEGLRPTTVPVFRGVEKA